MAKRTISFSKDDERILEELKHEYDAVSVNEVVRRTIKQCSDFSRFADDDGFVTMTEDDGTKVRIKVS